MTKSTVTNSWITGLVVLAAPHALMDAPRDRATEAAEAVTAWWRRPIVIEAT